MPEPIAQRAFGMYESRGCTEIIDLDTGCKVRAKSSLPMIDGAVVAMTVEHTSKPGDVLIEQELGRFAVSRAGANRQLTFRDFRDALRLGLVFGERNHVNVWVVVDGGDYLTASQFTSPIALE